MSDALLYPYPFTRATLPGVEVKRTDSAKENQATAYVRKSDGHVCALTSTREPGDFLAALKRMPKAALEQADIVLPDGWTLNDDGTAVRHVEVAGETVAILTTELVPLPTEAP